MSRARPYRTGPTINGIPKPEKRRGAPPTHPPEMSERFMVRCSPADLERWRTEAARRGLARGRDSGIGALARIALGVLCEHDGVLRARIDECETCLGAGRIRDDGIISSVRKCLNCNGTGQK